MPYDTSGIFNREFKWVDEAATTKKIRSDDHDKEDDGFATGLTLAICKDGRSTIGANIPWSGKKITNLATPTELGDAANKQYVDNPDPWSTTRVITGADENGRLRFHSLTGTQGIEWRGADLSWLAKLAEANKTQHRLVMNNKVDGGAGSTDVFIIDDAGRINNSGVLTNNLSWDGSTWRTKDPGTGTQITYTGGAFNLQSNDVATITNQYAAATLRSFFRVQNSSGSTFLTLNKKGTDKYNRIYAQNDGVNRWIMDIGNSTAESGTRKGSDFYLYSYDNTGANAVAEIYINRETHKVTFGGEISTANLTTTDALMTVGPSTAGSSFGMQRPITSGSTLIYGGTNTGTGSYLQLFGETHAANARDIILGTEGSYRYFYDYSTGIHSWKNNSTQTMSLNNSGDLNIIGQLNVDSIIQSSDTTMILASASGGAIYLRPNGAASSVEQTYVATDGDLHTSTDLYVGEASHSTYGIYAGAGVRGKVGSASSYTAHWMNSAWNGTTLTMYANTSVLGQVAWQCDYRIKKDVKPLASTWEAVKRLNPVRYTQRAYDIWVNDDTERWGFVAHELQERLTKSAASGEKDGPEIQGPNMMVIIAALTKALQEAMERIEVLEAKA
jgi:hypothetical protein